VLILVLKSEGKEEDTDQPSIEESIEIAEGNDEVTLIPLGNEPVILNEGKTLLILKESGNVSDILISLGNSDDMLKDGKPEPTENDEGNDVLVLRDVGKLVAKLIADGRGLDTENDKFALGAVITLPSKSFVISYSTTLLL